jgi:hypothetical protein
MEDCAWLPGDEGEHYARLIGGMDSMFELRSERARKAILRRRRCKLDSCGAVVGKGELYCKSHKDRNGDSDEPKYRRLSRSRRD